MVCISSSESSPSIPPEPSVFQRLCSSLILFSFLFQTLWPSFVFASEMEILRPDSPSAFFRVPPSEEGCLEAEGRIVFDIQVDNKDDDFDRASKRPLAFVPIGKSLAETQTLIEASFSLQTLYPGLNVQAEGLSWTQFGYSFLFRGSGDVWVSGTGELQNRSSVLRLYNPHGAVVLGAGLALDHLLVKGQNILHVGPNAITQVEVWATGEDSKTSGAFINGQDASFAVRELSLHQGQLQNDGEMTVYPSGVIDLKGHDFINRHKLALFSEARFVNGRLFDNKGSLTGLSYSLSAQLLRNQQDIKGEQIRLLAQTLFDNTGGIHSTHLTEILSLKNAENRGSITSEGDAYTTVQGLFLNQNDLVAKGQYILTLQGQFINAPGARVSGETSLEILGQGIVQNHGSFISAQRVVLQNKSFINHNRIEAKDALVLALEETFINKGTGSVVAEGFTTVEGRGVIENEAVLDPKAGIVLKGGVFFKDYQGEFINKGLFKSVTRVEGFLRKLRNSGVFKTEAGFESLTLPDFFNDTTGIMMGGGTVCLEGLNRGLWLADTLTLEITGEFSHGGGLFNMTDSLSTTGTGTFLVHSEIQSPSVSINTSHFENFSEWVQDQMTVWVGSKVTRWRNGNSKKGNKKAAMVVKELILAKSLLPSAVRVNEGTLKVGRFSNFALSFLNKGSMTLGQWAHQKHSFQNQKGGELTVTEGSDVDLDSLDNSGRITLRGMTKGRMDQLCNTGRLTFAGDTALTGTRLFNRNVLKALGLFDWRGQDIENTLKMALHSLHLQAKSFKNTGIYEIEENFTSAIDRFENGGTITVKKKTELTGNDLVLLGKLTSQEGLSYRGTHYVSAPETHLETLGDLDLTFSTPVTLKGTVKAKDGVDLWAPSLVNESQFQVSEGVTRFFLDQGLFLNTASLTVDDFYYKGTLINQGGQIKIGKVRPGIQTIVNLPKEAEKTKKPQEHSSGIRIGSGTVNPETVRNHSLFMMGKGKIETQGFDNEGGYADVDEFGFASKATPSIAGVFQAKKYTSSPLEHLDIQGSVTFLDGNMNAKDLLIAEQAVFSLGKGPHHTDKLHNLGMLVALKGMDLTTEILDNSCGVIESEAFRLVALEPDVKKRPDTAPTITITKFKKEGEKSQKTGVRGSSQLKPGTLKTKGDLTLELAAFVDIAYSLHQFGAKWQQGGTLSIYGGTFDQKNDIIHAGRVCLTVKEYKNPQFTLQTNGLDLFVKDRFELGESHTVMGKIQTVEDPKIKTEQDNSLSITLEKGDLKIPYGQIYGEGEVTLTSSQGKVEVGQSLEGSVTKKPFRTFNLNGDMFDENGLEVSGPWLRHYNHEAFPRIYNVAYQKPNASFVCSNSDITLWAQKGIFLNHADIDAEGRVALITRPTEEILNLSSKVKAGKDIRIKGRSYVHSRLAPYKAVQHEAGYEFWKEFAQSDPAHLEALGKILFDVNELHNIAGIIMGIGGLYDGSHHRHSTSKPLDILREYEQTYHVGASHQITLPYEASVPQVLSGTEAKLSARTAHFVGYLSAQDITFVADHLSVLFAMAAAWTNAGPSAGVHSTAPFVQKEGPEQGGGKYKRNPDGSVGYAVPKKDRSFDPGTAPVSGTKPLGFKPNARLYAPMNVFDSAAFDLMRRVAGRLYDKGLTGIQMLDRFLERGRHYARLGLLENPGSLRQVPEIIMFFREIPNGPVPLMILEMYFPESDVEEDAGKSATHKGVHETLTAGSIELIRARLKMELDETMTATEGDIKLMGTGISAGHNVNLTASQNLVFESLSERHIDDTNSYTDQKTTTFIHAGHDITAAAGLDAYRKGIVMKAGGNITLTAAGRIVDEALALARQTFHRQGGDWTLERVINQSISEYEAGGKFSQAAGVGQVLFAPKVTSQEAPLFISGEEGIRIHEVHDEHFLQSHKEGESGGLLGGGKNTEDVMNAEARSVGAQITGPEAAEFLSVGDIDLTNVSLQVPKTTLTSINGVVRILLGTNYARSARSSKKSDTLYQSQSMRQEQHQTYTASKIPGDVEIHAREVIVEQVRGDTLDWLERIQLHGAGGINTVWRDEIHKVESHSVRGPTAAFGAVIALAAGIATSGVGVGGAVVSLTGVTGTTAAVISGATSAVFTSLCSQAALSLATNNGDIGKAAKSLTTSEAFKAMGFSMATAGLSETGLGRAAAGFTVDVAMGKKIDEAALNAARVAVVSTLQATAAKYIGAGGLDPVTRGMMHGFTGAAAGAALGKDAKEGAISGAIAAVAATTVANFIKEDPNVIGERAVAKAKAEGSPLDKASLQPYVQAELRGMIDISRLSGAIATLFAGYDVNVGIDVATTAVINNCAATMERQVFESSALKKVLQEAAEVAKTTAADAMDKTADFIDEHPEKVERAAEAVVGAAGFMAEDRGGKAPKIKTKGQVKADKVLRKGVASGLKSLPKYFRKAADKIRGSAAAAKEWTKKVGKKPSEFTVKHGKKPVKEMSDGEFFDSVANRAEKALGEGKGPKLGQQKHKYAEKLTKRYQKMTGDRPEFDYEVPYKGGERWEKGMQRRGVSRPDAYNRKTGEAFDYKFGDAKLRQPQVDKLERNLPPNPYGDPVTVTEVKPTIPLSS